MPYSDEISDNKKEAETLDINVIKKGKRILIFLADFFINFILTFFIFNLIVMPIGKVATNYEARNNTYINEKKNSVEVLIKNKILFSKYDDGQDEHYSFSTNLSYTYDRFLSYYVLNEGETPDEDDKNFKHDISNEVTYTFFINVRKYNLNQYLSSFDKYNQTHKYFTKNETGFTLDKLYQDELHSYFESKQSHTLTNKGKEYYNNINETVFLKMYGDIMNDIKQNNLTFSLESKKILDYNASIKIISETETYHITLITYCSLIGYAFTWLIYYLILPLFMPNRASLGMLILKVDRVHFKTVTTFSKKMSAFSSIYALFSNLVMIMFLPLFLVSFNYLFNIAILTSLTLISLVFMLGSLIFLLFSNFNQTLSDKFTGSVMLLSEDLDAIYRSRGYISGR